MYAIFTAILQYEEKYGHFPLACVLNDSGQPVHSWRALTLEFIDSDLYRKYRFDEPWDGPNDRQLADKIGSIYSCPADSVRREKGMTNYLLVVGDQTLFPGSRSLSRTDINKDPADLILLVKSSDWDVHWMEPRDISLEEITNRSDSNPSEPLSSHHRRGATFVTLVGKRIPIRGVSADRFLQMFRCQTP